MKIISDAEQKKISSHGTNALTTALLEAQLGSCEKELAAERERIIEEIEKIIQKKVVSYLYCRCAWCKWQSLKAKIREGL